MLRLLKAAKLDAQRFARKLRRQFPSLKTDATRARAFCNRNYLYSQIYTKKHAGRPALPEITKAEQLFRKYRKTFPHDTKRQRWDRIRAEVLSNWAELKP